LAAAAVTSGAFPDVEGRVVEISSQLQILGAVALAMLLGAIVGFEREMAEKPAGLRTHMLVAGASALLVGLTDTMLRRFGATGEGLRADPIRVIEAVVTAVGFLGAGTIIRRSGGDRVEGLTTAAALLLSASVGVCVALGQLWLAGGVTALALMTLRVVKLLEDRLVRRRSPIPPRSANS
jgi:putative Mg2+ transporter-C (MgtC) family protein